VVDGSLIFILRLTTEDWENARENKEKSRIMDYDTMNRFLFKAPVGAASRREKNLFNSPDSRRDAAPT